MREYYIDKINYLHDVLKVVRDEHYSSESISEYDSVYQDILDYIENDFESFENLKDFEEYIKYLKDLIITGLEV